MTRMTIWAPSGRKSPHILSRGARSRRGVVEQQQPRDVEAEEYQDGQQHRLGPELVGSANDGKRSDNDVKNDRGHVRGQAQPVGGGKVAAPGTGTFYPDGRSE